MKAIITIEMPDGLNLDDYKAFVTVDRFSYSAEEREQTIFAEPMKFSWCDVKKMPDKYEGDKQAYEVGWNDAIEVISDEM